MGHLIKVAVDMDVSKLPALKAGLVVAEVVMSKGCVIVVAGLPDFSMSEGDLFFLGQGR